MSYNHHIFGK